MPTPLYNYTIRVYQLYPDGLIPDGEPIVFKNVSALEFPEDILEGLAFSLYEHPRQYSNDMHPDVMYTGVKYHPELPPAMTVFTVNRTVAPAVWRLSISEGYRHINNDHNTHFQMEIYPLENDTPEEIKANVTWFLETHSIYWLRSGSITDFSAPNFAHTETAGDYTRLISWHVYRATK